MSLKSRILGRFSVESSHNIVLGQGGSVYTTSSSDAIKPPLNRAFVAITMLEDTVFDASAGLVSTDANGYVNTETAAHDQAGGSETDSYGSGGQVVDGVTFPQGVTIYGSWSEIDVSSCKIIAYLG